MDILQTFEQLFHNAFDLLQREGNVPLHQAHKIVLDEIKDEEGGAPIVFLIRKKKKYC